MERRNFFKILAGAATGVVLLGKNGHTKLQSSNETHKNPNGKSAGSGVEVDGNGKGLIFDNKGNLGIGRGTPNYRFDLQS